MYLVCYPGTPLMHEKIYVNWKPSGLDSWILIRTQDPSIIPAVRINRSHYNSTVISEFNCSMTGFTLQKQSSTPPLTRWLIGYLTRAHIILSILTCLHYTPTHTLSRAEQRDLCMYVLLESEDKSRPRSGKIMIWGKSGSWSGEDLGKHGRFQRNSVRLWNTKANFQYICHWVSDSTSQPHNMFYGYLQYCTTKIPKKWHDTETKPIFTTHRTHSQSPAHY